MYAFDIYHLHVHDKFHLNPLTHAWNAKYQTGQARSRSEEYSNFPIKHELETNFPQSENYPIIARWYHLRKLSIISSPRLLASSLQSPASSHQGKKPASYLHIFGRGVVC